MSKVKTRPRSPHQVLATQVLKRDRPGEFFEVAYPIPEALTRGKSMVRITFNAHPDHIAGGVFGCVTRLME